MMSIYIDEDAGALDGFEFLTMAEAGEVGHWGVLGEMAKSAGSREMRQLVSKHLPIQRRHLKEATAASLKLASEEDPHEGGEESPTRSRSSTRRRSSSSGSRTSGSRNSSSRGRSGSTRRRPSS